MSSEQGARPYNPTAIGSLREIAPLIDEMRVFFAKCEGKRPSCGIQEVASLEIRFNATDFRIERALAALDELGEIDGRPCFRATSTCRALKLAEAAESTPLRSPVRRRGLHYPAASRWQRK
ncbi:hypothetical protein [Aurantimonas coralicida]|uniref:Putative ATP-dependent protease n=1 Tax=Aurantimonas coralicida TaxID=182270 RepID=A0A0P0YZM7_9HYPH|nr:hypothetical protein [Aurantimonas coralicida]BAT26862.1 putative ATP-dependent protease [Aurantimonas coralicida]